MTDTIHSNERKEFDLSSHLFMLHFISDSSGRAASIPVGWAMAQSY